ncbi:leucyl/phenylalanyl-tRNA--protein transferase [Luteitalea sp.]|jgi:leucyl/phenylalanyl-tRNA--protein transferase|uniref:leucyl/phenylalanyl-tRNA--protein transferase n=1 Tax=Luteitalea sp. TaxID=2004800 RepID=UPI0037C9F0D7
MRSRTRQTIDAELLLRAYALGWFPMGTGRRGRIEWFSPDPRGILPLEAFHAPSRLGRVVRQARFEVRIDTAFEAVMRACADRDETWITEDILQSYVALHRLGHGHSVETWQEGRLVGGLYGVALGGAFFGESMFHTATDASKVALVALVERLRARGFVLLDTQWVTPHLAQFGGTEIRRAEYLARLEAALPLACTFHGAA